jgi:hypothetical protein
MGCFPLELEEKYSDIKFEFFNMMLFFTAARFLLYIPSSALPVGEIVVCAASL